MRVVKTILLFFLSITTLLFLFAQTAHASIIDDIKNRIIKVYENTFGNKELKVDSQIYLSPDGDQNQNGEIDAGDIVTFSYIITNPASEKYRFATLKTNIDKRQINFIHNVKGATGLSDENNSVVIPNVRLDSLQILTISFDARINYFSNQDGLITTQAEFLTNDNRSLTKSEKKEIVAKKIDTKKIISTIRRVKNSQETKP